MNPKMPDKKTLGKNSLIIKKYRVKKSQLRNIIKESIKGLMKEQGSNEGCMKIRACWGGQARWRYGTVNGGTPQAGQVLDINWMGRIWYVDDVTGVGAGYAACSPAMVA